nr:hypothetical protein [Tanacetum cinerariifolium]
MLPVLVVDQMFVLFVHRTLVVSVLALMETMIYLLHRYCTLSLEGTCYSLPPEETSCFLPLEETSCSLPPEESSCSLPRLAAPYLLRRLATPYLLRGLATPGIDFDRREIRSRLLGLLIPIGGLLISIRGCLILFGVVLKYFKAHISQLVPLGLRKVITFEEVGVTRPDRKVVTKTDHVAKRKSSIGPEISTNVAKKTRSNKKGSGAGSSGQAAGDEVEQTDDGTLNDDDQRDGSEFAIEGIESLNNVS